MNENLINFFILLEEPALKITLQVFVFKGTTPKICFGIVLSISYFFYSKRLKMQSCGDTEHYAAVSPDV